MLKHLRWAILWAVIMLVLCLLPSRQLPEWHWFDLFDLDKLVHAGLFGVLALLLAQGFVSAGRPKRWALAAVCITVGYGIGTELLQGLEAMGRRTDVNDAIANSVGALIAAWYAHRRARAGKPPLPVRALR